MDSKPTYNNYPFWEIAKAVDEWAQKGAVCFQKFTCYKCGARQTIEAPNVLYRHGKCEECGEITNIELTGCNYMLMQSFNGPPVNKIFKL
jgi:hypothetical protein